MGKIYAFHYLSMHKSCLRDEEFLQTSNVDPFEWKTALWIESYFVDQYAIETEKKSWLKVET